MKQLELTSEYLEGATFNRTNRALHWLKAHLETGASLLSTLAGDLDADRHRKERREFGKKSGYFPKLVGLFGYERNCSFKETLFFW